MLDFSDRTRTGFSKLISRCAPIRKLIARTNLAIAEKRSGNTAGLNSAISGHQKLDENASLVRSVLTSGNPIHLSNFDFLTG